MMNIRNAVDTVVFRVTLTFVALIPASILALLAVPVSLFLGMSGFVFTRPTVAGLAPNAVLSLLGLVGAWLRVLFRNTAMSERLRIVVRRLLMCGVVSALYWAVIGVPALELKSTVSVICWALACIGAVLAYATTSLVESTNRWNRAYLAAAVSCGVLGALYAAIPQLSVPEPDIPAFITTASLEARYGGYLDEVESLEVSGAPMDAEANLRATLLRDTAVLQLVGKSSRSDFSYQRDKTPLSYACTATSEPSQAGISHCKIKQESGILGRAALLYERSSGSERVAVLLDFDRVAHLLRNGITGASE